MASTRSSSWRASLVGYVGFVMVVLAIAMSLVWLRGQGCPKASQTNAGIFGGAAPVGEGDEESMAGEGVAHGSADGAGDGDGGDASEDRGGEQADADSSETGDVVTGGTGASGDETSPGGGLSLPEADEWQVSESSLDLTACATDLVEGYRAGHDCVLRYAGYLDVFGDVWGCVVEGAGWADICVVEERADEQGSVVRTVRLYAEETLD